MTADDLVNEITDWADNDKMVITRSGEDFFSSRLNFAQTLWGYLAQTYFYKPDTKNIASSDGVTNLSIHEAGGAQEKPNGWRIKPSWTGGDGSNTHLFTGTTYTINGLAIALWVGKGAGDITLELDKTNSNWIIVDASDHIWDRYPIVDSGVNVDRIVEVKCNRYARVLGRYKNASLSMTVSAANTNGGYGSAIVDITHGVTFAAGQKQSQLSLVGQMLDSQGATVFSHAKGTINSTTVIKVQFLKGTSDNDVDVEAQYSIEGFI